MINGHGDDSYKYPRGIELNFSSNINPWGTSETLIRYLRENIGAIGAYPEPSARNLADRIEDVYGLGKGTVLVTNGAVEAFYLLAALHRGKHSLIYVPSFAEYQDACLQYGHEVEYRANGQLETFDDADQFDMVWICNPNNPDGKTIEKKALLQLVQAHPETLFLLDEAYTEFTLAELSLIGEAPQLPNLVVIRSMTKRYAMPGLRLGYIVTAPSTIKKIGKIIMPWRINTLALQAGLHCLSDQYHDNFSIGELIQESQKLQQAIQGIEGFEVFPSPTNYFLAAAPCNAEMLKDQLAIKYKILIRDASNFKCLSKKHLRISVQTSEKNHRLAEVLSNWKNWIEK